MMSPHDKYKYDKYHQHDQHEPYDTHDEPDAKQTNDWDKDTAHIPSHSKPWLLQALLEAAGYLSPPELERVTGINTGARR